MLQELVLNTPILTGKAKAEWQIGLDTPPSGELLARTRPPSQVDYEAYAAAAVGELASYSSGRTIYIVNNAPYINALNAGSSRQAAANFVEASVAEAFKALKATLK